MRNRLEGSAGSPGPGWLISDLHRFEQFEVVVWRQQRLAEQSALVTFQLREPEQ